MARIQWLADDLVLIDTEYLGSPNSIAAYLLLGDRPALIETGPASTVDEVLEGVRAAGLHPEALQAAAVTHIHLDHAGAAGSLAGRIPHLHVYVHPVGAPHLADPTRLVASARRLYGEALETLFGHIVPVPAERVHAVQDGTVLELGRRRLRLLETPGHATHHLAYLDETSGDLFTGDAAGVVMPGSRYVAPPVPPPDLDFAAWRGSISRMRAARPRRLLLTHFGPHQGAEELLTQLQDRLDARERFAAEIAAQGWDEAEVAARFGAIVATEMAEVGAQAPARGFEAVMPARNNVLGLLHYATRRLGPARPRA
ncbi:MAG: MBL fold metallo-hydrolase [Armatimonadota bacterium]|nr:MBL fold metallo-hydrolase [Armatimonadota bacterium]